MVTEHVVHVTAPDAVSVTHLIHLSVQQLHHLSGIHDRFYCHYSTINVLHLDDNTAADENPLTEGKHELLVYHTVKVELVLYYI